jgi:hypothetical protein
MQTFSRLNLLILLLVSSVNSLHLNCNFVNGNLWTYGPGYQCLGQLLQIGDPHRIEGITGTHLAGRTNDDVRILTINGQPIGSLPTNVGSIFPKLEGYECRGGRLTVLTKENFMDLPNLKQAELLDNELQEIDNIFENNKELLTVRFANNPIRHVESQAFDHLDKLTQLHMHYTCIHEWAINDRPAVLRIITQLISRCPPSQRMIENEFLKSDRLKTLIDEQVSERMNPMVWTLHDHERRIEELEARNCTVQC